jgi:hypothetical protein
VSSMTLTLIATPDPPEQNAAQLRDRLAVLTQEYGELLAAAQATVAAVAAGLPHSLGYLTDHLTFLGAVPPAGAQPVDYQPTGSTDPAWGRW